MKENSTQPGGRGFGRLRKGEKVTSLGDLRVGDILLTYSRQLHAENTIRITNDRPHPWLEEGEIVYWRYVNPDNTDDFLGPEYSMWAFELNGEGVLLKSDLWRAQSPELSARCTIAAVSRIADLPLFAAF